MSKRRKKAAPDLAALLDSWQVALAAERKSDKTIDVYTTGVRTYIKWCRDNDVAAVLDRSTVQQFTAALLKAGAQPHTARTRQQALRRYSAWLLDEDEIDSNELLGMKQPQLDEKITEPLDEDELKLLLKACDGKTMRDRRDEAVVRFMLETGARAGEVAAMTLDDVDVKRGLAIIRRGKGGRGRPVPFGPQAGIAIDRYVRLRRSHRLAHTDALWLGDRGTTCSYSALQRSLGYRAQLAGIDRFHPHILRHTAATRWLAAGGSEGGLMAVAGWKSRQMLDRYVAHTKSERAAHEARTLNLGNL